MSTWQVQSAKQRFSEVVRAAQAGDPQFITKHGEPVVVVIDIAEYRRDHEVRLPFIDFLLSVPEFGEADLPERFAVPDRSASLFAEDE